ncbi:MAG: HAD-IIB family hydrolase [Granulosicoccus sp.]|nr:HAD-IIB family hydrolase [Granulosicoccus sp.]
MTELLCTDLDRTLLPNGEQPESPLARPVLWQLLRHHDIALAYVSGRDLDRILEAIDEYQLPVPDVIVADVGTSIHVPVSGQWQRHGDWDDHIARDWNGLDSAAIREKLSAFTELQDQEHDRQSRHKRSYYLQRQIDPVALRQRLDEQLCAGGIKASLVFSDDPEKGVQLLDVLPRNATKLEAMVHVQKMLGIANEATLFSGDSGNDATALASGLPSVTVANADDATREAVRRLARQNGSEASCYQAAGSLPLADGHSLNGNYAAGIVEGLVHFNPSWNAELLSSEWIKAAIAAQGTPRSPQSRRA